MMKFKYGIQNSEGCLLVESDDEAFVADVAKDLANAAPNESLFIVARLVEVVTIPAVQLFITDDFDEPTSPFDFSDVRPDYSSAPYRYDNHGTDGCPVKGCDGNHG